MSVDNVHNHFQQKLCILHRKKEAFVGSLILQWLALEEGHKSVLVDDRAFDRLAFYRIRDPFADAGCVEDRVSGLLVEADHRSGLAKVDNLLAKCKVCHVGLFLRLLPLGKIRDVVSFR